jgi:hypothetical protein
VCWPLSVTEIYEAWDGQKSKLKIPEFQPNFSSDNQPLEHINFTFDKKYIESFSSFISCFKDQKLITLSEAMERIRKSSNWPTYEDCKRIASRYSRLAEWRCKNPTILRIKRVVGGHVCKDLGWKLIHGFLKKSCMSTQVS